MFRQWVFDRLDLIGWIQPLNLTTTIYPTTKKVSHPIWHVLPRNPYAFGKKSTNNR
jgi:hypothetical protein